MLHIERLKWFEKIFEDKKENYSEIKRISSPNGDLGDLEGMEFNSDIQGGYIHFWSSGYIGFQIVDYIKGCEIIVDTLLEVNESQNLTDVLSNFISKL